MIIWTLNIVHLHGGFDKGKQERFKRLMQAKGCRATADHEPAQFPVDFILGSEKVPNSLYHSKEETTTAQEKSVVNRAK